MYSPSIYSVVQVNPGLIQLSILYKIVEKIYKDHIYLY